MSEALQGKWWHVFIPTPAISRNPLASTVTIILIHSFDSRYSLSGGRCSESQQHVDEIGAEGFFRADGTVADKQHVEERRNPEVPNSCSTDY